MSIPIQHAHREAFHFVHLDNLEGIIRDGLLSNAEQLRRCVSHHSIAIAKIQNTRSTMEVTCDPGGVVHDYVPFYFCKRSPMLLSVVNARNVDQQFLVYLVVPISILDDEGTVFTDSSANRANDPPNFFTRASDLDHLSWGEIDSHKWNSATEDLKQQKMAELLIHNDVPWSSVSRVIVWNDGIASAVREMCEEAGVPCPQIDFDSHHYYTKYPSAPDQSLVTGPYWTKRRYEETVARLLPKLGDANNPRFQKLIHLRNALRGSLENLPETAELIGLESAYGVHFEDLGAHTERVTDGLRQLPEFNELEATDQILVEIAAYLHDIGKGPKARWAQTGGKYRDDRDHPVGALPMVERILTDEVGEMHRRSARVICKLVCYHDLIGDIIGKGRREEQLFEIIDDTRELNMLVALAKADVMAVRGQWWDQDAVNELSVRAVDHLENSDDDDDE
jgi:hypothetical protein